MRLSIQAAISLGCMTARKANEQNILDNTKIKFLIELIEKQFLEYNTKVHTEYPS